MNTRTLKLADIRENHLKDIAHILVDSEIGLMSNINHVPRYSTDPLFFHFSGTAANTAAFAKEKNFGNSGGASLIKETAILKSIGEAIERYSSAIFDLESLPLTSYNDAHFHCVEPENFALYDESQFEREGFKFVPFTRETPVRWTEMTDLLTNKSIYVPGVAVYMPYYCYQGTGDMPILQPISTGLACHTSFEKAAIAAICEVIERDAIMICWQAMLPMPQIRVETISDYNYEIVKRLEENGSKVVLLDITLEHGVPTILSVLTSNGTKDAPALVFAGASDPDAEKALRKSLEELPHTRRYCSRLMNYSPTFTPDFPLHNNVTDQAEHLHFYCDHGNAKYADFIFKSTKRKSFDEIRSISDPQPKITLRKLIKALSGSCKYLCLTELTSSDVKELGLFVVRAVIPNFQRLCMGHGYRTLGGSRLWTLPQALGFKGLDKTQGDNPAPHPYP